MAEKINLEPGLPPLLAETTATMDALMLAPVIQAALKTAVDQDEACLAEQIEITEIPAWPFGEHLRAADFVERFKRYGL